MITQRDGSDAMWATMVNQGTGMRVLNQSLEIHSLNPSKTPFFDTLSTASFGYGGEPNDVSYLKMSKGRFYDFSGSFRRDRNYFDYNLLANSFLSTATARMPVLVPEPDSLHLFNTVRRNTDTLLTLLPLSRVSFRAGFNHGTHEGPTYTTVHDGGDVQLSQWFRNVTRHLHRRSGRKAGQAHHAQLRPVLRVLQGRHDIPAGANAFTLPNGTPIVARRRYSDGPPRPAALARTRRGNRQRHCQSVLQRQTTVRAKWRRRAPLSRRSSCASARTTGTAVS